MTILLKKVKSRHGGEFSQHDRMIKIKAGAAVYQIKLVKAKVVDWPQQTA